MNSRELQAVISRVNPPCMILKAGQVVAASEGLLPDADLPMSVKQLDGLFRDLPEGIIQDIKAGAATNSYPYSWKGRRHTVAGMSVFKNVIFPLSIGDDNLFLLLSTDTFPDSVLADLPVAAMYTSAGNAMEIIFVSASIERWTGLPLEKFSGQEGLFSLVIHPEDRSRVINALKSITPETREFSIAYRLTHKAGAITWVKQEMFPHSSGDPCSSHFFLLMDITAWKEKQLALSQAEERYRLFFQRGPLAIMCIDRLGFIIDCNQRLAKLAGLKRKNVLGKNTLSSKHAILRDYAREVLRGSEVRFQGEYLPPGAGRKIIISASAFPLRNEEGEVVGGYAFIEDITNRAELEKRLDKERDFNRMTIETAGILVAEVLSDGRVVRTNRVINEISGTHERDSRNEIFWELFVDRARQKKFAEIFERTVRTGQTGTVESKLPADGEKQRQISWKIGLCPYSLPDQYSEAVHLIIVGTDISSERSLEEQISEIQKMDAIGRLAGGVAHDFNNQLTAILGYCQMLVMDAEPKSVTHQQLKIIEKAARRAAETTNQLLAFSRKQALKPRRVSLNQAVRDSSMLFERLLGENITVEFSFSREDIVIEVDPGRFQQVLLNLALNARDAMEKGGTITIVTGLRQGAEFSEAGLSDQGIYASIEVRDTGCGMEPDVLEKAFEPFFTTKPVGQGTGLGLAMVYGTIKQSGGHVFIESSPDRGTLVNMLLPVSEMGTDTKKEEDFCKTFLCAEPGQLAMVVEDEELVKRTVSDYLKHLGFGVILFSSAADALEYLKDSQCRKPSLLITDVVMPTISGLSLAEKIRGIIPDLPVLFMSGYSPEVVEKYGILPEKIPFLSKPFTISELSRRLQKVLKPI